LNEAEDTATVDPYEDLLLSVATAADHASFLFAEAPELSFLSCCRRMTLPWMQLIFIFVAEI
jgi:hypothetical protein